MGKKKKKKEENPSTFLQYAKLAQRKIFA